MAPAMTSSLGAVETVDADDVSDVAASRPFCQSFIHSAAALFSAAVAASLARDAFIVSFAASSLSPPPISERSPHPADDPASSEWDPKNERPEPSVAVVAAVDASAPTELAAALASLTGGATYPVRADCWGPDDLRGAPLESVVAIFVAA